MAQSYPMDKILPDGVHPSEFGYQLLSEIIFSEVSQAVRRHYTE
jgi:lysophospholipase L1-like esterase